MPNLFDPGGRPRYTDRLLEELPASGGSGELAQALQPWLEDARTTSSATQVLMQIGAPAHSVLAAALTNDKQPHSARLSIVYAIESPSTFRVSQLLPVLQPALKSENPGQRLAAALAILRLDPRNVEALPLVLACLSNADKDLEEYALAGLRESAEAEVDVKAAIPDLIAILTKLPADLARDFLDDDPRIQARYKASDILWLTRARPEDLPPLQASLVRLAAPQDRNRQPIEKINSYAAWKIGNAASMMIQALGTIGAPATVALPEIRQILTQGRGVNDDGVVERYAQGIVGIGEPAIEMVIELAKQPDANRPGRVLAIQVLGRIGDGDQRTTAILTELLKDPDVEVRVAAAMILAEQPATFEAAVPILSEGLKIGPDPESYHDGRGNIIERLLGFKSQAQGAVPGLLELVKNEKAGEELRIQTAKALLQISPDAPEVRAAYLACLNSVSEYRTDNLLSPIDKLPATLLSEIVAELTRVVADAAHPRREAAARLLGQFEDKAAAALPALRALITADQGPLGATATIAVARIDPTAKDLVPRVVELLISDIRRQSEAAEALRRQGPNVASELPKIIKFYQTRGRFDYQAFRIIGSMGAEAKPGLPILLAETLKRERFNYSAFDALKELGPNAAELWPQLLTQLQEHDDLPGVALALAAIGGEPAREAVAILQKQLADENRRLSAISQLAEISRLSESKTLAAPAVPELIKFVAGTDSELRRAALSALYYPSREAQGTAEMLATLLTDPDPQVAASAANTLADLSAAALPVLPQVIAALEKPRRCTQSHLINCLQKLGHASKEAIPTLTKLRATTDLKLRHQVRLALEKIESKAP